MSELSASQRAFVRRKIRQALAHQVALWDIQSEIESELNVAVDAMADDIRTLATSYDSVSEARKIDTSTLDEQITEWLEDDKSDDDERDEEPGPDSDQTKFLSHWHSGKLAAGQHWSSPNGCHRNCPVCKKERTVSES